MTFSHQLPTNNNLLLCPMSHTDKTLSADASTCAPKTPRQLRKKPKQPHEEAVWDEKDSKWKVPFGHTNELIAWGSHLRNVKRAQDNPRKPAAPAPTTKPKDSEKPHEQARWMDNKWKVPFGVQKGKEWVTWDSYLRRQTRKAKPQATAPKEAKKEAPPKAKKVAEKPHDEAELNDKGDWMVPFGHNGKSIKWDSHLKNVRNGKKVSSSTPTAPAKVPSTARPGKLIFPDSEKRTQKNRAKKVAEKAEAEQTELELQQAKQELQQVLQQAKQELQQVLQQAKQELQQTKQGLDVASSRGVNVPQSIYSDAGN